MMGRIAFLLAPDGAAAGSVVYDTIPTYPGDEVAPDDGRADAEAKPEGGETTEQEQQRPGVAEGMETGSAKNDGAKVPAWMAQLPNDLKNDPSLASYRTVGDLARALKSKEAEKPAESQEAPSESVSEPMKYENFSKRLKEDIDPYGTISDGLVDELQTMGIPQDKAERILDAVEGRTVDSYAKLVKDGIRHTEGEVRKLWGREFDKNRALMARGYQALKDDDGSLQKRLDEEGASCSPAVWDLLSRVGRLVAEDKASESQRRTAPTIDLDDLPEYPK